MKKIFETPEMKISVCENSNILTAPSSIEAKYNFDYSTDSYTVHSDWKSMEIIF